MTNLLIPDICIFMVLCISCRFDDQPSAKRGKREKGIGGGLQAYTQYVCAKLEKEQQMSNIDVWTGSLSNKIDC